MKIFISILLLSLLIVGLLFGADENEGFLGPNNLRNNSSLQYYRENELGIPEYVQGDLFTNKAKAGNEFQTALSFFEEYKGAFKMANPSVELSLKRIDQDNLNMRHVRINQTYQGLRVIGSELIAHFKSDGTLRTVNGHYQPYIEMDINPVVSDGQATIIAEDDLKEFFGAGNPGEAELVIFPWEGTNYLAWRMFLYSDTPMGRWEYFVDAKTGEVVYKANRIMNTNDVGTGTGVMGDAREHIDTDYTGSTYQMKDYTRQLNNNPHGHDGQMPDGNYIQTNLATTTLPGSIATDADNVWGSVSTQPPAVDGHVYTGLVYDYMVHHLDRNGYDDNGASMLTIVNYSGDGDNNAYWDGSRIVIWSWSTGWRSLAGCPDVIAHEWGHAVTENCSDLVYQKEPGALNEAFSDMIGAAFEFAHDTLDTPDWLMGENGQTSGAGFRDMSDPHAFSDPDYYGTSDPYWYDVENCTPSYFNDYCGVHTNGGVGNKWFYLLSDGDTHNGITVDGIGVQNAILVAYRANAYYWTSSTDYHEGALGTISAALDLDPTSQWAGQAALAWNAVGVSTPTPSLTFSYPEGIPEYCTPGQTTTFAVEVAGYLGGSPVSGSGELHYRINGGSYTTVAMTEQSTNYYQATLPVGACEDIFEFYVSADETTYGTFEDPGSDDPYSTVVATSVTEIFSDNFESDLGWTVSGDAADGDWTRGVPVGGGDRGDPPDDFDGSGSCYLTDNVDGNSDVDDGTTILTSPTFDLSGGDGKIHYARWYSNTAGSAPNEDVMEIYISNDNGSNWTLVESVGPDGDEANGDWYEHTFWASDFVTPTDQMKLRFDASDLDDGSVVEAGVDDVWVKSYECIGTNLIITTESLPDWTEGQGYSYQLEYQGGIGEITWSDKNNDLSGSGLSLSTSGLLSGTPLSSGEITFTAYVEDESSQFDEETYSFDINTAVEITTASLPDWTAGKAYSQQLEATGGTSPTVWADKNGDLSGTGLTLSTSGLVSGTPTAAGFIAFTAIITDAPGSSDEVAYSFQINAAIAVTTASLQDWTIGLPYSAQLEATGGTGTLSWNDYGLNLEGTGLSLSTEGLLSGTPSSAGAINFTARATDQVSATGQKAFSFTINSAVSITTTSLPAWTEGAAYSQQLVSSGGTGTIVWSDATGGLSGSGLSLNTDGLVSGTPSAAGTVSFTAHAQDNPGSYDESPLEIIINTAVKITSAILPGGLEDEAYSYQLESSGGTAPVTWTDKNDDLSAIGLSLSTEGLLSGTPTESGIFQFTAVASDAAGSTNEKLFSLNIGVPYICGDANSDDVVNVSDAVAIINYVFIGGAAPEPILSGDTNCDAVVNVSDAVQIINYVFIGGYPPCDTDNNGEPDC